MTISWATYENFVNDHQLGQRRTCCECTEAVIALHGLEAPALDKHTPWSPGVSSQNCFENIFGTQALKIYCPSRDLHSIEKPRADSL